MSKQEQEQFLPNEESKDEQREDESEFKASLSKEWAELTHHSWNDWYGIAGDINEVHNIISGLEWRKELSEIQKRKSIGGYLWAITTRSGPQLREWKREILTNSDELARLDLLEETINNARQLFNNLKNELGKLRLKKRKSGDRSVGTYLLPKSYEELISLVEELRNQCVKANELIYGRKTGFFSD